MRALFSSAGRLVLGVGFGAAFAILAPVACLFPSYTFTEPEPTGAGGSSSAGVPTSAQGGGGASSNTDPSSGSGPDASTSAGGNGGGGGSSSVSSSSGSNPIEDCGNGKDDNGDSKADCADPFCGTYACVSEGPLDWIGYYALYEGPSETDPGCPLTFPIPEYTGNLPLVGEACSGGHQPCNASINLSAPALSGGSYAPTPQAANLVPSTWATLGRACRQATPGIGCNSAQVCLGKLVAPYQKGICIKKDGENICPVTFPNQHIYVSSFTSTPSGEQVIGKVTVGSTTFCCK